MWDLGVLFVHGIGNQRQGETLAQWGDGLVELLASWGQKDLDKDVSVTVDQAVLRPKPGELACSALTLSSETRTSRWLLAEAWWAADVLPPSFGEVATWSFRVVPTTLLDYVGSRVRRTREDFENRRGRAKLRAGVSGLVTLLVGIPLGLALAPILVALLALLLVVGLAPIGSVRAAVMRLQGMLAGTLGDSLILLESPVQRAAMEERVLAGIRFLREQRCQKIAIVAHSQGAAVTRLALLQDAHGKPIDLLFTVGSGIKKLEQLRLARRASTGLAWAPSAAMAAAAAIGGVLWSEARAGALQLDRLALALAVTFAGITLFGLAVWIAKLLSWGERGINWLVGIGTVCLLALMWFAQDIDPAVTPAYFGLLAALLVVVYIMHVATEEAPRVEPDLSDQVLSWIDLYARSDPVPRGPTKTGKPDWPRSEEVRNLDSLVRDHTTYVTARDDALTRIARGLLNLNPAGPIQLTEKEEERLDWGTQHRRWRLAWLRWSRWTTALATGIALLRVRPALENAIVAGYSGLLAGADWERPGWLPEQLSGANAETAGSVGILLLGIAAYGAVAGIWVLWDRRERAIPLTQDEPIRDGGEPYRQWIQQEADSTGFRVIVATLLVIVTLGALGAQAVSAIGEASAAEIFTGVLISVVFLRMCGQFAAVAFTRGIYRRVTEELEIPVHD